MYIVYKHTSKTSGKSYVGFTPRKSQINLGEVANADRGKIAYSLMMKRWRGHLRDARYDLNRLFANAIRKYGARDFTHEVLEICETFDEVGDREAFWVEKLETFSNPEKGYNMTPGGDGVKSLREKDLARLKERTQEAMKRPEVRQRHLAAQASEQCRKRKSESATAAWRRPEVRKKQATAMERRILRGMGHRVQQCDLETGEVLNEFKSVSEASRQTGIHKSSILNHLHGNQSHSGGFRWKRV